jgi:hypothetical protein
MPGTQNRRGSNFVIAAMIRTRFALLRSTGTCGYLRLVEAVVGSRDSQRYEKVCTMYLHASKK